MTLQLRSRLSTLWCGACSSIPSSPAASARPPLPKRLLYPCLSAQDQASRAWITARRGPSGLWVRLRCAGEVQWRPAQPAGEEEEEEAAAAEAAAEAVGEESPSRWRAGWLMVSGMVGAALHPLPRWLLTAPSSLPLPSCPLHANQVAAPSIKWRWPLFICRSLSSPLQFAADGTPVSLATGARRGGDNLTPSSTVCHHSPLLLPLPPPRRR